MKAVRKTLIKQHKTLPSLHKYELLDKIRAMDDLRDQALVCFLYITGARVSEVCTFIVEKNRYRVLTDRKTHEKYHAPIYERTTKGVSIMKKQIDIDDEFMVVNNIRTLKRGKELLRSVPILIRKDEKFMAYIKEYLNTLDDDDSLFPIVRSRAYQILSKHGLFPHYLRHIRLTHLVTIYDFRVPDLQKITGWRRTSSAESYIHLSVSDLKERLRMVK